MKAIIDLAKLKTPVGFTMAALGLIFIITVYIGLVWTQNEPPTLIDGCLVVTVHWCITILFVLRLKSSTDQAIGLGPWTIGWIACCASLIAQYAFIYYRIGIIGADGLLQGSIGASLYFSIVSWTTLGYGDFPPPASIWLLAANEALLGYANMALILGLILSIIGRPNTIETEERHET